MPAPDLAVAEAILDARRPAAGTAYRAQPAVIWELFAEALTGYNQALAQEA